MSIASTVKEGQIDEICRTADAFTKSVVRTALEELIAEGELETEGAQRVISNGDRLRAKMIPAYKVAIAELSTKRTSCLALISSGKKVVIKATTGKKLISGAKDTFPGWIDADFTNYGCDVLGEAKPETPVEVFEMTAAADFSGIFGSFDVELDDLAFDQEQVIEFARENTDWLHPEGYATLLLFKVGKGGKKKFFVARVCRSAGRLEAYAHHFSIDYVWDAEHRYRVVVPQLKLKS
ncbi:MAG TPA: hypothetical protein VJH67_02435 [Candidatus Paceibacterota bacterium]